MKKTFLFLSALVLSFGVKAQLTDFVPGSLAELEYIIIDEEVPNVEGSSFYEEQYTSGIILENEKPMLRAYLRYDAMEDHVGVKVLPAGKDVYLLPRNQKFSYRINDYTYILDKRRTEEGEVLEGYFMRFYKGDKVSLFGKPSIRITRSRRDKTAFEDRTSSKMDVYIDYYLAKNDLPLKKVKLKEKDFRKILSDMPGMKEYFKDNRVNGKKEVVEMLKYYEQQLKQVM